LRTIEVRNVAPHFSCGTGRQQPINLPIVGGKLPPAHGSYRDFIGIMVREWRQVSLKLAPSESDSRLYCSLLLIKSDAWGLNDRRGCNFHLTTIGKISPSVEKEPIYTYV
jgi:hypothetical protein